MSPDEPEDAGDAGAAADSTSDSRSPHDSAGLDLVRSLAAAYRSAKRASGQRGGPTRADGSNADGSARGTGRLPRRRGGRGAAQLSGAHPDERDPQPLDAAIDRVVTEHGWRTDLAVRGVFARWPQIVGPEVSRHCAPAHYADAELTVQADSTAWATSMRMLAATVVRRLNDELGDGTVTRIRVEGPAAPSWRHGRRSVRGGKGPRDTYG